MKEAINHFLYLDLEKTIVYLAKSIGDRMVRLEATTINPDEDDQFLYMKDLLDALIKTSKDITEVKV